MSRERRREPRYPYRLPITLKFAGAAQETISEDVSYRGMFAITDEPPTQRSLISVSARLPDSGKTINTHAMSVFALERGNRLGRTPGAGLQFYAMAGEVKTAWEAFIDSVRRKLSPPVPDTNPRRHVRYRLKLAVKPRSVDELMTLYTRDVSRGGMFLLTKQALEIGREIEVEVFHPITDEVFTLECVVRRATEGQQAGIGVEFHTLDDRGREAFAEFVHSALPELDASDIELIDADDPQLE
jgi:Tfp pilus assembly protein PilZ